MREYGPEQAASDGASVAAQQLLGVLLDVALEPDERRTFLADAIRFLGIGRAEVRSFVEARYGAIEWTRTEMCLTKPWVEAVNYPEGDGHEAG